MQKTAMATRALLHHAWDVTRAALTLPTTLTYLQVLQGLPG
jgi:hypothetical protein